MLMNINQAILWAAGFLEGDGCFSLYKDKYLAVQVTQVNPEPIADLVRWFGGAVYYTKDKRPNCNGFYNWRLTRHDAAALMMTLYSFMSEKRKNQIKKCLKVWRTVLNRRQNEIECVNGHKLQGINLIWHTTSCSVKYKACKQCKIEQNKRSSFKRSKLVNITSAD